MEESQYSQLQDLARQILTHLIEQPSAGDTLEGVAEWWLLRQHIRKNLAGVQLALDWLVSEGYLVEIAINGSLPFYRVNRESIERFPQSS
jgi:hypothetical protein